MKRARKSSPAKQEGYPYHVYAEAFPMMSPDEFLLLVGDMKQTGFRRDEPIILYEGKVLDGRNRQAGALAAKVKPVYRQYDKRRDGHPIDLVIAKNIGRRQLTTSQKAMAIVTLGQYGHGGARRGEATKDASRKKLGKLYDLSERSLDSAAKVRGQGARELQRAVVAGDVSVKAAAEVASLPKATQVKLTKEGEAAVLKAAGEIRKRKTEERRVDKVKRMIAIAAGNAPLDTTQRCALLVADPPWRYERPLMGDTDRSIENKYPTMPLPDICALPVHEMMLPASALALWVTAPQLFLVTSAVCMAWGDPHWNDPDKRDPRLWFTPRAQLIWDKVDEDGTGRPGMGHYFRTQHEYLIFATRGDFPLPPTSARPRSVFRQRASKVHSEKPAQAFDYLRAMYPELVEAGLAVEMFARAGNLHAGFRPWGNQALERAA